MKTLLQQIEDTMQPKKKLKKKSKTSLFHSPVQNWQNALTESQDTTRKASAKSNRKKSLGKIKLKSYSHKDFIKDLQSDSEDIPLLNAALQACEQSKFELEASKIAALVEEKQKAYGDSFGKAGKIMTILYPNGIPLHKLDDALTVVRILDKLFRIATDKDALGESPFKDIMGYSLLSIVKDAAKKSTHADNKAVGAFKLKKLV